MAPDPEIKGGIEGVEGPFGWDSACARCGSNVEWVKCPHCVGGMSHHDCGEDSCCCLRPKLNVRCGECKGDGGSWHCLATPEHCQAHPMPGREHIRSTAMSSQAWRDVL